MRHRLFATLFLISLASVAGADATLQSHTLRATHLENNLVGVAPERRIRVMLPPGYDESDQRYPVLYWLHTFFEDEATFFDQQQGHLPFMRAFDDGAMPEAIIVTADFGTPAGGSLYTNSPVTGHWRDFVVEELVPFVDANFRTLPDRASRGILGYHAGGYGAIRIASRHPDVFGMVYALHPVATGHGHTLMQSRPDWTLLASAERLSDLDDDVISRLFTAIYQANLPNPANPPLYFDPPARLEDGKIVLDAARIDTLQRGFFLERQVGELADNMKKLIAFKFDWGRHDGNQDHVYSNQFYSRKLNEYGVPHEAEEYNGGWGDKTFEPGGRIETDVIPFFRRHLKTGDAL